MRLVFCGTPDFAVPSLEALLGAGFDVPLVVSRPDKVRGRRGRPEPTPIRRFAQQHAIETAVLERGGRAALYDQILGLSPDVVVVVAFGHIIREPLLRGARFGCVNVHASALPRWRGPAPIHTAIVAGDRSTGVCTMQLEEGVDTGDVYLCETTPIGARETVGELHDRLAQLGSDVLVRTLRGLEEGRVVARAQDASGATHAPLLTRDEASVDFAVPAQRVHDRIRGFDPWPSVSVDLQGERWKLSASQGVEGAAEGHPGQVLGIDETGALIACGEGAVRVAQLQPAGGRPSRPLDLRRGRRLDVGARFSPLSGFSTVEARA